MIRSVLRTMQPISKSRITLSANRFFTSNGVSPLIETGELRKSLDNDPAGLTILDGSWWLPMHSRDPIKEFNESRIPGARYFNIDEVCDKNTHLPHMLPDETSFQEHAARLGITKSKPVVVYDKAGLFSAARVWWTLTVFGHPEVRVLNGGMPKWEAEGNPVDREAPTINPPIPKEEWTLDRSMVVSMEEVSRIIDSMEAVSAEGEPTNLLPIVVDARPGPRFTAEAPEPRPGMLNGHMPSARSVPHSSLLQADAFNTFKSSEELHKIFANAGINPAREGDIITSCGSGVTASVLFLGLVLAGRDMEAIRLYDGSWSEWGSYPDNKCAKGPASPFADINNL